MKFIGKNTGKEDILYLRKVQLQDWIEIGQTVFVNILLSSVIIFTQWKGE